MLRKTKLKTKFTWSKFNKFLQLKKQTENKAVNCFNWSTAKLEADKHTNGVCWR